MTGLTASPSSQWDGLVRHRERWRVAQAEVWTCGPEARALLLATHAAHHGMGADGPLEDLRRGIATFPLELWRGVWALARELGGVDAFGAGPRLLPAGSGLAARLGVPTGSSREVRLQALGAPPLVLGAHRVATTPGIRGKIALVRSELLPSADFLRWWSPVARRGRLGLLATQLWRPLWFVLQIPSALVTWVRSQRISGGDRP